MILWQNFYSNSKSHSTLGRAVVIQQRPYAKQGSPAAIIYVAMHMFSEDKSILWDKENMKFITAMVEVLPSVVSFIVQLCIIFDIIIILTHFLPLVFSGAIERY